MSGHTTHSKGEMKHNAVAAQQGMVLQRKCACGQHTIGGSACGACSRKEQKLQRRSTGRDDSLEVPPVVHEVLSSPGHPLDAETRLFMESRFHHDFSRIRTQTALPQMSAGNVMIGPANDHYEREADALASEITRAPVSTTGDARTHTGYDLSGVRVHADAKAAQSAQAVNAQAYTVGNHVVFAEGQYAPSTSGGRELLAHELAHGGQHGGAPSRLQRRLEVDGPDPLGPPDPASSIPRATRTAMVQTLVQNLCDSFTINSSGAVDEVVDSGDVCDDTAALTSGPKPTGCCCLCIMVNSPNTWKIRVVQNIGASTSFPDVIIPPSTSVVESMHWTDGTTGTAHVVQRPRQITLGHELCGHAALMEINAHPAPADRTTTTVHDPTIRIERLIWGEQGLPAAEQRGLAASGPHRGESLSRVTVERFRFNSSDVSLLPAAERAKISTARDFIVANDWFVDVLGHSDPAGTPAAKTAVSEARARAVRSELVGLGVPTTISSIHLPGTVSRFTRVAGLSDSQPLPASTPHELWRRVDILMANFPAGAQVPPPGTPTATNFAPPGSVTGTVGAMLSPDACIRHMSRGAWF